MKVYRIPEDDFYCGARISSFNVSNYVYYFPKLGLLIKESGVSTLIKESGVSTFSDDDEEIKRVQNIVDNGRAKYELEIPERIVAAIISRGKQLNRAINDFQEAVQNLEQAVEISEQNLPQIAETA